MAIFKDKNNRPVVEPPVIEAIPVYVRRFPHWVLWRFDWNQNSQTWAKVPYSGISLSNAASDDPQTWMPFAELVEVYEREQAHFDGIGFVFTPYDDLCGIDFDNCVGPQGLDVDMAQRLDFFDSYAELSVTGTGLHIIVRGVWGKGRKDAATDIEVYDRGRYFTFSGQVWHSPAKAVRWRQVELDQLKSDLFPEPVQKRIEPFQIGKTADELLRMAFTAKNGSSILKLYQGKMDGYKKPNGDDDPSRADQALCSKLAFWSGGSSVLLDEMFRGSRLYREKWDEKHSGDGRSYGELTIEKALLTCENFYNPQGNVYVMEPDVSGEQVNLNEEVKEIFNVSDLRDDLYELYDKGRTPGEHPGWNNLAELYTVKRRQFTIVTGIPNVGKTPFLDNVMMNLAKSRDWRFAICSLENEREEHLSMLLEIYTGEPFNDGPTPRMSKDTVERSLDWFEDHFVFITPDESNCTIPHFIELLDQGNKPDGVIVDPWNEFEHRRPVAMTETEYVSHTLTKMRRYARANDQHWWLVAHPTKLYKTKDGDYPVPTLYDVSGSAHFRNKPHMGIVLWRDVLTEGSPLVVYVQKVKHRWCGKLGNCELYYSSLTGRFHEYPNDARRDGYSSFVDRDDDDEVF